MDMERSTIKQETPESLMTDEIIHNSAGTDLIISALYYPGTNCEGVTELKLDGLMTDNHHKYEVFLAKRGTNFPECEKEFKQDTPFPAVKQEIMDIKKEENDDVSKEEIPKTGNQMTEEDIQDCEKYIKLEDDMHRQCVDNLNETVQTETQLVVMKNELSEEDIREEFVKSERFADKVSAPIWLYMELLLPFYERGMDNYSSEKSKVLLKEAVVKTGLSEPMIKRWIDNYKRKSRHATRPSAPKVKVPVRAKRGRDLFYTENMHKHAEKSKAEKMRTIAEAWNMLSDKEKEAYNCVAKSAPKPPTSDCMNDKQKQVRIRELMKNMQKEAEALNNLGYKGVLILTISEEGELDVSGSDRCVDWISQRSDVQFSLLATCTSDGPVITKDPHMEKRKLVQEIFNRKYMVVSRTITLPPTGNKQDKTVPKKRKRKSPALNEASTSQEPEIQSAGDAEDEMQVHQSKPKEELYKVERVLRSKVVRGKKSFLVKWKGYETPTWEPEENDLAGINQVE